MNGYCRNIPDHNFFIDKNTKQQYFSDRVRMEIPSGMGNGWMETIRLDRGLTIGLCDYRLDRPFEGSYSDQNTTLGFNLLVSGSFDLDSPDMKTNEPVRSGELYLRRGPLENVHHIQPKGCAIRGLSIEMPSAMIDAWLDEASGSIARPLEKMIRCKHASNCASRSCLAPLSCPPNSLSAITQAAVRLLAMPRDTICAKLQFESVVLDMLAKILSLDHSRNEARSKRRLQQRAAVDEAVDILQAEWSAPPTISALARRVGTNECYLKSEFRQRTGLSIGSFVRKLRMEKALELIESGKCNILQTAQSVGYNNPSHFSTAFKRFHGRLPSYYLTRV